MTELLAAMSLSGVAAAAVMPVSVVLLGLFGYRHGLFLATVVGLVLLTGFFGALALAPAGAAFLESFDCPAAYSLTASYCSLFALAAAACRFGIGEIVQEDDVRLGGAIDKVGGLVVGGVTGMLVAGAVLVGWSMWQLPRGLKPDMTSMKSDAGAKALRAFARCIHTDLQLRDRLLHGDFERSTATTTADGGGRVRASEPFVDIDGDWVRGDNEPYLDYDHNGTFTTSAPVIDRSSGGQGRRAVGLLDAYWLGSWRAVRVDTAPQFTSPARIDADTRGTERPLLLLAAADADDGDTLTYSMVSKDGDDSPLATVDPTTGEVTLTISQVGSDLQSLRLKAVVTDRSGLTDEREFTVTLPRGSG
jgi:uncharacterized membrane protein required for colicin V production